MAEGEAGGRRRASAPGLPWPVLRGGALLLGRQLAGAVVAFFGMLALARLLGPAQNGLYFTAFGIVFFVQNVARLGLDVFLVRAPEPVGKPLFDQVFLLLCTLGLVTGALLAAAGPLIAAALRMPDLQTPLVAMAATIPVMHLARVPVAKLERELAFGRIGAAELAAQALFFATAIPAALAGAGPFAPVLGWWAQQTALLAAGFALARYRPGLPRDLALAREALAHGSLVTAAILVQSLRSLIVPVVVGGTLGPAAVGIVALSTRLIDTLSMARTVIARIAVPLLGRLAADRPRLLATLGVGIEVQTAAVALPVLAFALTAGRLVPLLFGPGWGEAARVAVLLAPSAIVAAVFSLHLQLLATEPRPLGLVLAQAAAAALAWPAAALAVPRLGLEGYAAAEAVAALAWIVPAHIVRRRLGPARYGTAIVWGAAASLAALAPLAGWWLLTPLPALALLPRTRAVLRILSGSAPGSSGGRAATG
ncbi:MAG: oligosaccharide flippase family protein [Amaricoccus sp.]